MQDVIEAIRIALAPDATEEVRAADATACRSLLIALEARPGETLSTPTPPAPTVPPEAIANIVTALRGVPAEQLLDLAIARLRAALPPQAPPSVSPLKFQLVPIPRRG